MVNFQSKKERETVLVQTIWKGKTNLICEISTIENPRIYISHYLLWYIGLNSRPPYYFILKAKIPTFENPRIDISHYLLWHRGVSPPAPSLLLPLNASLGVWVYPKSKTDLILETPLLKSLELIYHIISFVIYRSQPPPPLLLPLDTPLGGLSLS